MLGRVPIAFWFALMGLLVVAAVLGTRLVRAVTAAQRARLSAE